MALIAEVEIKAGEHARRSPLISAPLSAEQIAPHAGRPLVAIEAEKHGITPAQWDPVAMTVVFVAGGELAAGSTRRYRLEAVEAGPAALHPVRLTVKLDRIEVHVGDGAGSLFGSYNYQCSRRPYFWPLYGPGGDSIVRGSGTGEHPHHMGLSLAYGGHGEGGSTNIWSDWDEEPYGPGGRMVHRGFREVVSGPVFGRFVQDMVYTNAHGDPIVEERRALTIWWTSAARRYIDWRFSATRPDEQGAHPFLLAARLPKSLDIPNAGKVTSPHGEGHRQDSAEWVDGSGPASRGPHGLAILDHPANPSFPGPIGRVAVNQQLTHSQYPPKELKDGRFTFQYRVFVHAGNAAEAEVPAEFQNYAHPVEVATKAIG